MKKRISLLFLLIPLMCIPLINVGAANSKEEIKTVTLGKVQNGSNYVQINVPGIHNGYFYSIQLGNAIGLCMDAGKRLRTGATYVLERTLPSNPGSVTSMTATERYEVQAYLYAQDHPGDMKARAVAQIFSWLHGDFSQINDPNLNTQPMWWAVNLGLKQFISNDTEREKVADQYIKAIINYPIPSDFKYLGIWKHTSQPDVYQRILSIASYEPEEPEDNCKIQTVSDLPVCQGTANFDMGFVYQTAVGQCYKNFNKKVGNVRSKYGQMENANVGSYCRVYCLKEFVEVTPGNIAKSVNVGRYIVWPNTKTETDNRYKVNANLSYYPLILQINKKCHVSPDKDAMTNDYNTYYNYLTSYKSAHNDIWNGYVASDRTCNYYESVRADKAEKYKAAQDEVKKAQDVVPPCSKASAINPYTHEKIEYCSNAAAINAAQAVVAQKQVVADAAHRELQKAELDLSYCNELKTRVNYVVDLIKDYNSCFTYNAKITLNFDVPGISATYDDDEYGKTMGLRVTNTQRKCDDCNSTVGKIDVTKYNAETNVSKIITQKYNATDARNIVATTTKKYELDKGYYYYVNKDNNKAIDNISGINNYSIIGFSNMPVSYNANPKKTYNLSLNIASLTGDASIFSKEVGSNNYVCHYKVTKTTSGSCICPEGTKHAGESLDCLSKNNNGTCLDNQEQYCNSDQEIPHSCSSDDLTCPSDPSMDLSACVNAGKTYDWCVSNFCSGGNTPGNQRWVCPSGTNEGMDLSSCVIPMIIKGYSERDAYNYCKDVTCPYKGIKIIYRVIDLTNPFPSKDADSIVTQRDLRVGMFNDELKGRYPGANWNSTTVVKNKILNNRGKDGDKVYDKEPLYTFIVDTSNIKEIRKYNNAQRESYSDFKLNCLDGRTACKSDFVHNSIYGLKGGTCKNVSKGNFYTCAS